MTRCSSTIENQLSNLDRYAIGSGIEDLAGIAAGRLGVVVSAGPSLRKNLPLLAAPGVRDRCVIVATQTTLKPLLAAGVAPHFVTALDYHPISRRFYEGIDPAAVEDTELIIDSKVHRAVPAAWPGRIRCIPSPELDQFLGPLAAGHPPLEASATVAHLAYVLARHLGCDPVALIGQDLGFTDGLYYAPGTAIHDVWLPELNAFNTIETMEWERIVRHRTHLAEREDVHGRRIFTDAQMLNYLQLFEMRFTADVASGLTVIDATEGGRPESGSTRSLGRSRTPWPPMPAPEQEATSICRSASECLIPAKRLSGRSNDWLEGLATRESGRSRRPPMGPSRSCAPDACRRSTTESSTDEPALRRGSTAMQDARRRAGVRAEDHRRHQSGRRLQADAGGSADRTLDRP